MPSTDFSGYPDGTDLGSVSGWTRTSGTAGSAIVNSDGRVDIVSVATDSYYTVNVGSGDQEFSITFVSASVAGFYYPATIKGVDINNIGLLARVVAGDTIQLAKRIGGTYTTLVSGIPTGTRAPNDVLKVKYQAGRAIVLYNNVEKINIAHTIDPVAADGQKAGLLIRDSTGADRFTSASWDIFPDQVVQHVNSGAGITAGSTGNTAQLSGFSSAPTSAMHGPLAMTGLSYNGVSQGLTFNDVPYADGQTRPPFDGVADFTVVASGSSQTATLSNVPTNPPLGWAQVTISSPNTADPTYIGAHTDITNHEIAYETRIGESALFPAEGLVVYPDGSVYIPADLAGEQTMYKRNLTTGVITELAVTINDASEVVSVGGLTTRGLTATGLIARGLVARGL